eukprot:CAMPEP_0175927662 /NCGR_PEP_ID=MMETSP0108-20121206/16842_1 /TAXON_ID=195067 ORGANISM="Goniomonas pacifica, Strain CCMP1869" /NCGR_SAMPLE_ID=MMETSP0108 /ASSEMBLY_ACC=CAM_ASM_000204 /LENGTH=80 /DNA_ID=CAMNT_0017250981 /DNA_START=630 /DNA_END=872 /DNA_ORIENTATION=+
MPSLALTSAPAARRHRTTSTCLLRAAQCSGAGFPKTPAPFTLAPRLRAASTSPTLPRNVASMRSRSGLPPTPGHHNSNVA